METQNNKIERDPKAMTIAKVIYNSGVSYGRQPHSTEDRIDIPSSAQMIMDYSDSNTIKLLGDLLHTTKEVEMLNNKVELIEEDLESVHLFLDSLNIPRADEKDTYSIVGRIKFLMRLYNK